MIYPDAIYHNDMPLVPDAVRDWISDSCLQQNRNHTYCTQRGVVGKTQPFKTEMSILSSYPIHNFKQRGRRERWRETIG